LLAELRATGSALGVEGDPLDYASPTEIEDESATKSPEGSNGTATEVIDDYADEY